MHSRARAQIKECYERHSSGDPNFQDLILSMKKRLRSTVGDRYWKEAQERLNVQIQQMLATPSGHAGESTNPWGDNCCLNGKRKF